MRPAPHGAERSRWYVQLFAVAILLWLLDAVDKFRSGAQAAGLRHAVTVAAISRRVGGEASVGMNHWLAPHPLLAAAAAGYYIVLHGLVTGIAGIWLLRRRPPGFALHRDALIATSVIAVVVFWVYPVAPPRMLPGYHDIAADSVPLFSHVLETRAADQFAAFPSLHVTWALWVAVALRALLRRRIWRLAIWAYPALTTLDVMATANHYLLDVVSAPAVLLLAYAMAAGGLARRARRVRLREWLPGWRQRAAARVTAAARGGALTSRRGRLWPVRETAGDTRHRASGSHRGTVETL